MVRFAEGLALRRVTTVTFDFGYTTAKKKIPDKNDVLEARWLEVFEAARSEFPMSRIAIGGKSMGGRIASQVVARCALDVSCLAFFGYPLHPPGKPETRRDAHLPLIKVPMLFVQGARDTFASEAELVPLAESLGASVHIVPHGDHSLVVPKKSGLVQQEVYAAAIDAAADFIILHSKMNPTPTPTPK